ncbi:uncharacterized protein LOC131357882 [Hemibagrus wyckioides]|uniref:uncharacterized protein LOC131357882 n=1 Tax=Hemibagrus wyckioides TaxID=337641 RepID=UPI00266D8838|nr:uncharacterized protein LOC131357882 [Hemibagrus wyckioides]
MPQLVGKRLAYEDIDISEEFKTSGFKMDVTDKNISLTIPRIKKEDEGLYYCAESFMDDFILSSGTYLAVTGNGDVKVSVLQHGMWDSIRCESGSSTHTCVYNVSKNILSFNDTGTYYCTMALCGNIVSGNGTPVQYENVPKLGPEVIYLTVAVGVCVVVIFAQAFIICKVRNCEQSRVRSQKCSTVEKTSNQGRDAEEMNYAALHFNKRNTNKMKRKGEKPKDCVYSEVRHAT